MIAELADLLESEYGPVPQPLLDEAATAWPDTEQAAVVLRDIDDDLLVKRAPEADVTVL